MLVNVLIRLSDMTERFVILSLNGETFLEPKGAL